MGKRKYSGGRRGRRSGWTYFFAGMAVLVILWFVVLPIVGVFLAPFFASWFRPPQSGQGIPCKIEIYVKEDLAKTTVDINVDLYTDDPRFAQPGGRTIQHPLYGLLYEGESATASSGKVTFAESYFSGMKVYLQARQAAPSSADPYLTPLREYVIGEVAEAGDTYPLGNLWVRDVSGTAPTITVHDQNGNVITTNTNTHWINTTDTSISLIFSGIDSDTWYGVETGDKTVTEQGLTISLLVDWQTEYSYCNIIYWKGTKPQDISTPHLTYSDPTNIYYIFFFEPFKDDANDPNDGTMVFTISFASTLTADSSVTLDAFDCQRFDTIATLVFSGRLNPTAFTTKVA